MKRGRRLLQSGAVCAILVVCAGAAFGAQEGDASAATERASEIFKWINFVILFGFFLWLCLKKAPGFFRRQADVISSAITRATAAKGEADRTLQEAETRMARLEQEIAELRAQGQKDAAAEGERIRALARIDAEKIAQAAKAEIEAAERAARVELKKIAAKLAVDRTESLLAERLTPKAQEALISEFVKNLQGRPN